MTDTMTELKAHIPNAIIDIRYATTNNVLGKKIYKTSDLFLLTEAAEALEKVAQELRKQGFNIVIWDAYRSPQAQTFLRQFCDDDRYVAKISNHSKGVAVDITLADIKTGKYLDMGTDFDTFNDKAHSNFAELTKDQNNNREILRAAMAKRGFKQLSTEWWHFDYEKLTDGTVIDKLIEESS